MPAASRCQMIWADAICGNTIDATSFNEQVLLGFVDVRANYAKLLSNRYLAVALDVYGARAQRLSRSSSEDIRVREHAPTKVTYAGNHPARQFYYRHRGA